ncbi:hypothetical protein A3F02_01845 [Candidatus Curtissbacteria bacterium RIFCSPHIGHO2_12_FULL_38_9b]|uniref:Uncharacterized protein n=2 Tax=Candidatus Curtissiibacteriota TaxID=1752717 RepID=A0A1F5GUZ4_9BACT|nr:MAG: hypothetical protein A3A48_00540 [Candidatus Curtissbacteria bacterium RIFCSPLOWO2_01_FULL_37_9]OGD95654.1 MAG: hypothetical protein A3F02_01845 [Candidatus Curtissbacteria bacterium RIFCSPHIGHO2_12_FULL_38_9b]
MIAKAIVSPASKRVRKSFFNIQPLRIASKFNIVKIYGIFSKRKKIMSVGSFKRSFFLSVLVSLLIFPILTLGLLSKTALAVNFDPSFGVNVTDTTAGATSNVTSSIAQVTGDDLLRNTTFHVPAGWNISDGSSFAQDEVVGNGTFSEFNTNINQVFSGNLVFRNDLTIQPGDKAHWLLDVTDPVSGFVFLTLDTYVSGDISSGHTIQIVRNVNLPHIITPAQFEFTFFGKTASNTTVFTNPPLAGNYLWSADMTSENGLSASKSQTLSMPGSMTPTGTNVEVGLGNDTSVIFDSVSTAGVTTIATSETAPPEGTGQFQLAPGGTYYDFNSTATFSCPCTITLPYDPVATSDPRLYHLEDGVWVDRTTSVDTVNHTVTGVVSSFSFFAVGTPNFNVSWEKQIEKRIEKDGNPFELKENQNLNLKFNILDPNGQIVTPENVTVEIWQIKDEAGNEITPVQAVTFDVDLKKKDDYRAKLKAKKAEFVLGTYEIRVLVGNTTASQSPTAGVELVGK